MTYTGIHLGSKAVPLKKRVHNNNIFPFTDRETEMETAWHSQIYTPNLWFDPEQK